jgi:stearoyl-CoA desaturase (delta-9 desaturase)
LAEIKKVAPKMQTTKVKELCDLETVKTLFNNRIQVMANFTQEVLRQVCNEESSKLKTGKSPEFRALRKAHLLMRKEWTSMDDNARTKLESILNNNQNLQFVYQMKIKLQEIIAANQQANQDSSLSHLQDWCKKAEESGIAALAQFSMNLKRYSLS